MKIFLIIGFCSLFLLANSISLTKSSKNDLIMKVKVEEIQESDFAPEVKPPKDSYLVVIYKVLKVCKGEYQENEIKVAHFGDTTKDLKIGDEICSRFEPTRRFRETAESALNDFGIIIPEESLADFVFAGANQPCSCSE